MNFHHPISVFLAFSFFVATTAFAVRNNSIECDRKCGDKRIATRVPYPFGFSDGCPIRLNCGHNGEIRVGDFQVQNFTADGILVNIPANCSRRIEDLGVLNGGNFAMTSRNGFLLGNCSGAPQSGNCMIPAGMVVSKLGLRGCDVESGTLNCYFEDRDDFLTPEKLKSSTNCSVLMSAIAIDMGSGRNSTSGVVSMEFQAVELGWWLDGECGGNASSNYCDSNANCTDVLTAKNGVKGYRCRCNEGFDGDGFADGGGCQKVSDCNASEYISGGCNRTRLGTLVGGIIAGASLMLVVALICHCIRRRTTFLSKRTSTKRLLCEAAGSSNVPFFPYKDIERATCGFSEKQRLGTGAYGTVYAGKLHNDEWVAIKKLRHRDPDGVEQVMNEIKLLSSVSHPNLVRLLGCCIENGEQILVYEFMPNGTLSQHLQRERGSGLPWTIRLTIATETAHAITHLHSAMNPPIYHRDIKSSNILLDFNFNSKVADFGLSRFGLTDDSHISTAPQGTPGYVDPQYHQNYHLSDKSDVYSFGVVLVEIITAKKVVDFSRPHSEINLAALAIDRIGKGRIDEVIDPFLELHRDAWTLSSVYKVAELAFRCLAFHRDMRPSMIEVAEELEQIRLSGWAPLEENLCVGSVVSVASSGSSPYNGSEKSVNSTSKKAAIGSRRLSIPQKAAECCLSTMEEVKHSSPVTVHDPWLSEESSPSANSLLSNAVRK